MICNLQTIEKGENGTEKTSPVQHKSEWEKGRNKKKKKKKKPKQKYGKYKNKIKLN